MSEYIERNRLKTVIEKNFGHGTIEPILQLIDEQPTADVRENVKGEWIEDGALTKCSVCGNTSEFCGTENFCYNCGADMRSQECNT